MFEIFNHDNILWVLSITAIASTIGLFFCGAQLCLKIKKRGSADGVNGAPFLITFLSCVLWLRYGWLRDDDAVIMVNLIGATMEGVYIWYYHRKTRNPHFLNRLLIIGVVIIIATFYFTFDDGEDLTEKIEMLGTACVFLNVLTNSTPLADLGVVIRSKSTESLPLPIIIASMLVSIQWFLYGLLIDDFFLQLPNGISTIICSIQISLFFIYPSNALSRKYKPLTIEEEKLMALESNI
uniref:Sugar transporter SWEET n=1 Tax=Rhabditophanes sp. KR3021 TaxID=114890 RepID=A0AC35U4E8_9BILA